MALPVHSPSRHGKIENVTIPEEKAQSVGSVLLHLVYLAMMAGALWFLVWCIRLGG